MLRFKSLGSGSAGNATLIEATCGTLTTRVLVDCGLGLRQLDARLHEAGTTADGLDAIFVTHEHGDHIGCARALALRDRVPVWMSHGTHAACDSPDFDGLLNRASDGVAIEVGALWLQPFTVPHDAREPLQLTCTDGDMRLGILTDLGHATAHVLERLAGCHALLLEANHDPGLLDASAYPAFLKARVSGLYGHLSNASAAAIAGSVKHPRLNRVVAAHLSEQNNSPERAQAALALALGCMPADIGVARQATGTAWISV